MTRMISKMSESNVVTRGCWDNESVMAERLEQKIHRPRSAGEQKGLHRVARVVR